MRTVQELTESYNKTELQLPNLSYYLIKTEDLKFAVYVYAYVVHYSFQIPLKPSVTHGYGNLLKYVQNQLMVGINSGC